MPRPRAALAAAALALAALAACGDDEAAGDRTPMSSSDADGPRAESAADAAAPCEAGSGEVVTVEIGDFAYAPEAVEVARCDQVVWRNAHDQAHTATGDGTSSFDTGNLAPGATSEPVTFEQPGPQAYICALHPFMGGTVQVS